MNDYQIAMDNEIKNSLNEKLVNIEKFLDSDVIFYYGDIFPLQEYSYRDLIENLQDDKKHSRLSIILNTPGGDVITVEKLANINREFYDEVNFIVPDQAMSAGTVFCLSGDNIFMEYSSSLGPVDPQVYSLKQQQWLPALGYIDKMNEAIQKSLNNQLSTLEFLLLKDLDIAFLQECDQQMKLTIQLIKEWLVKYKFKNWINHSDGTLVTNKEKEQRAEEIANMLNNNKIWCSHGRFINIKKLRNILRLKIDDYGEKPELKKLIRSYNALVISYILRHSVPRFIHSRNFI